MVLETGRGTHPPHSSLKIQFLTVFLKAVSRSSSDVIELSNTEQLNTTAQTPGTRWLVLLL